MEGFIAQAESSKMHRNEGFGLKLEESLDGFLRVHMDIALGGGVVGADGEEGDFHREALPDFLKSFKISAVAAVENRAPRICDVEPAEAAMRVVQDSCAPMPSWRERDTKVAKLKRFPVF